MANVKDDDVETLDFADEGEWMDDEEDEAPILLSTEIGHMIADFYSRGTVDSDYDLAQRIIARVQERTVDPQ